VKEGLEKLQKEAADARAESSKLRTECEQLRTKVRQQCDIIHRLQGESSKLQRIVHTMEKERAAVPKHSSDAEGISSEVPGKRSLGSLFQSRANKAKKKRLNLGKDSKFKISRSASEGTHVDDDINDESEIDRGVPCSGSPVLPSRDASPPDSLFVERGGKAPGAPGDQGAALREGVFRSVRSITGPGKKMKWDSLSQEDSEGTAERPAGESSLEWTRTEGRNEKYSRMKGKKSSGRATPPSPDRYWGTRFPDSLSQHQ